jgi:nitroreductase
VDSTVTVEPDSTVRALADLEELVAARRTSLLVDRDRPVHRDLLERLCRLVFLAPNHKRTWPWRVAVFTGPARADLGEAFVADMLSAAQATGTEVPAAKVDKTRTKYGRAPAIVVVGVAPNDDPVRHAEDLHAAAAGVQNLLLGAQAAGLAAMWSSPPCVDAPTTATFAGFEPGSELVAVVYLGHPNSQPPPTERAAPVLHWHDGA